MAKQKKQGKGKKSDAKPQAKYDVPGARESLRAIREEARSALESGNSRPINSIIILVETALKQLSGKAAG